MVSGQIIDAIIYVTLHMQPLLVFVVGFNVLVGIFGIYGASLLAWLFQDEILQFSINTLGVSQNIAHLLFLFLFGYFLFGSYSRCQNFNRIIQIIWH